MPKHRTLPTAARESFARSLALLEPFPARYETASDMVATAVHLGLARITLGYVPRAPGAQAHPFLAFGRNARLISAEELSRPCLSHVSGVRRAHDDVRSGAILAAGDDARTWALWITTERPIPYQRAASALGWCLGACLMLLRHPERQDDPELEPDRGVHDALLAARRFVRGGLRADLLERRAAAATVAIGAPGLARGLTRPALLPRALVELGDRVVALEQTRLAHHAYTLAYEAAVLLGQLRSGAAAALGLGAAQIDGAYGPASELWYGQAARLAVRVGEREVALKAIDGLCAAALTRRRVPAARTMLTNALPLVASAGLSSAVIRIHESLTVLDKMRDDDRTLPGLPRPLPARSRVGEQ